MRRYCYSRERLCHVIWTVQTNLDWRIVDGFRIRLYEIIVVSDARAANTCTCANGTPRAGSACTENRANMCSGCNTGYRPVGVSCVGVPSVSRECIFVWRTIVTLHVHVRWRDAANGCQCRNGVATPPCSSILLSKYIDDWLGNGSTTTGFVVCSLMYVDGGRV